MNAMTATIAAELRAEFAAIWVDFPLASAAAVKDDPPMRVHAAIKSGGPL